METNLGKPSKRRRVHKSGTTDETLWQQCHSGFDNDIILKEELGLNVRPGKSRKKDNKVPERKTKEISSLIEKDADIHWESSSSGEDEAISNLQPGGQRSKEPAVKSFRLQQPAFVMSLSLSHGDASREEDFIVQKVEESPESTPSADREVEEAEISDYDSFEEEGSLQVSSSPPKQAPASPKINSTQSPLISSFTLSTQGSSETSPIPSSQWVDKVRRRQQTTPCKEAGKGGRQPEAEEGKDSAKKRVKFTRFGFAEKLQKLINREKSDVAIWNHQAVSESATSNSSCSVRIETVKASRGLFVARCQKVASSPNARGHGDGDLPEMLVLLFNRKMVEDLKLKSGTTLTVHPPWQTMILPDTGETVMLCTYYCQLIGSEGQSPSSPSGGTMRPFLDVTTAPRPVFRPNRLFAEEGVSSRLSLNAPTVPQNENGQPSTSLVDTVSAKGPSFDFEFDLRGLVLRVCRTVSPRPSSNLTEERWRMLAQDGDGTIFEIISVSSLDMAVWRGKLMDFKALRISQRVSRTSNPSLFSMIDSLSQPKTLEEECSSSMSPQPVGSSFSLQSISYITTLENAESLRECRDSKSLAMYNHVLPGFDFRLADICKSSLRLRHHRVNFWATLLHAASQGAADPLAPSQLAEAEDLLLFVSDSSLPTMSESDLGTNGYVTLEKLASCPTSIGEYSSLKELSGYIFKFEDVNIKDDGSFILDCYSNVTRESEIDGKDKNENISDGNGKGVTVQFPELTDVTSTNSLVTLTGTFKGVDQDTAYSWPTCNICGSNRLKGDSSGTKLSCVICDREVTSPVTEIHLEAFVMSPMLKGETPVKVLLKQTTVADVFGEPSSDKPFDLKRILGKSYQKTNCFVRRSPADGDGFVLEEI